MSVSRLWLALVLGLFCLPLFVGLGRGDVQDDEAIYSFGVDRLLESGDWLAPKSIPYEDEPFLEKPPLKFWIVAGPMRLGLLPHNEFGLRFWDAAFGGAAFVYVFLIGTRLMNPIAGVMAVLILFVHSRLIFDHGLRSHNMEAALLLGYCGGVYHFLAWAGPSSARRRPALHAMAVGLYFVLGFMTKFVAALFLPAVLGLAMLTMPAYRRRLLAAWPTWAAVGVLVLALVLPWFVWASVRYGAFLWDMMFASHVVTRFTAYLDPAHVQPWHFYVTEMRHELAVSGTLFFAATGLLVLLVQTVKRRWPEGLVVLLWFSVPVVAISLGTSKLYHYLYPFLPALALAGGYAVALALAVLPAPLNRLMRERLSPWRRTLELIWQRSWLRGALLAVAVAAAGLALATLVVGPVRVELPGIGTFSSSGIFRPILVALVFGVLGGAIRAATRTLVVVLVVSLLPLPAYRRTLVRLTEGEAPLRSARDCVLDVQRRVAGPGLHVDAPPAAISYPLYYYLRRVRPWTRAETASELFDRYLHDPDSWRPILVWEPTYQRYWHGSNGDGDPPALRRASPSMLVFEDIASNTLLLLPGPYAACAAEAGGR